VRHLFCYDTGSILYMLELEFSFHVVCKSLWSRMRFVKEVSVIGGSLLDFLGASCSSSVFASSTVSVSMPVVLRVAKKLRVNTAF
jgi:hypothetical protein